MLTESTNCESDTDENNNRKIDWILTDSRSSLKDEYLKRDERKDIKCVEDIENCKTLISKFDKKGDLARNLSDYNRLPTWVRCFETFEIELVEQEDTVKYEKVLSPMFCSDDYFPAMDSSKERRDCSKSLAKVQKLGVNPFKIGILINKSDFLEHCRMVKNGSLNHYLKNKRVSSHIEDERLELYSKGLELTADEEVIANAPITETQGGYATNEYEKTSRVKLSSHDNFTCKTKKFDKIKSFKNNQKTIDLSHSKSVSDLIQHFESNCSGEPHKKKRDGSRSIKRNRKINHSKININAERETKIPTQYERNCLESDLSSCSMQKANDSFVYNMSDGSSHESSIVRFVQLEDLSYSSVGNHSELLAPLEVFWYLVVMIAIFWLLIVM